MFFHFKNNIDLEQTNQDSVKKDFLWNNFLESKIDYPDNLFENFNLPSNFR